MLTHNNKQYRNLVEQVQKNKEDIANHYAIDRTLANFGITIIGQVATIDQLPDPETYTGEYGYAYAVGESGSYVYYIFTRPDPDSGHPTNYWLDVGALNIVGPQGPQGPEGPQGEPGPQVKWTTGPTGYEPPYAEEGEFFIDIETGFLKRFMLNHWFSILNMKGPQGVQGIQGIQGIQGPQGQQGPKGDTGDAGRFINIAGIITNTGQLPDPASLDNLSLAYLLGTEAPYALYIQVGNTSDTAIWTNVGEFNTATLVTVNGQSQNMWNADTKLDKVTTTDANLRVYSINEDGSQTTTPASYAENEHHLVLRASGGVIYTPTPTSNTMAANKKYVDDIAVTKLTKPAADTANQRPRVAVVRSDGTEGSYDIVSYPVQFCIPTYGTGGRLQSNTPVVDSDVVNLEYFNDNTKTYYEHNIYASDTDNNQCLSITRYITTSPTPITTYEGFKTALVDSKVAYFESNGSGGPCGGESGYSFYDATGSEEGGDSKESGSIDFFTFGELAFVGFTWQTPLSINDFVREII